MVDLSQLPEEERGVLQLMDSAAQLQVDRDLKSLERIIDLGDQVAARIITMQATREGGQEGPLPE